MGIAAFSCNVTYSPGGGGSLSQSFNVAAPYTAISSGKIDVPAATAAATSFPIPFGGVGVDARGFLVQNNTDSDLEIDLSASGTAQYRLAPGGLVMHWAAKKAGGASLKAADVTVASLTIDAGAIDYIVLGE
ncbi:MAG: hypothetical protein JNK04_01220 [Myxococcales bacterium]|nr:hypothetical protein [Myxococcales bacterium]